MAAKFAKGPALRAGARPRRRSTAAWTATSPPGCGSNRTCSPRCSPPRTARSAWRRSSRTAPARPSSPERRSDRSAPQPHATAEQVEAAWTRPEAGQHPLPRLGGRHATTRSGRSRSTSAASTTPATGSSTSPDAAAGRTPKSLELGCGTGFFTLNLKLAGVIDEGHVTDLSPGMVEVAQRNARSARLRGRGTGRRRRAAALRRRHASTSSSGTPCCTTSPTSSWRSARCCACSSPAAGSSSPASRPSTATSSRAGCRGSPGGRRPTSPGCRALSALAPSAGRSWTSPRARPRWRRSSTSTPSRRPSSPASRARAGAEDVHVATAELLASWFGWPVRTFECAVPKEQARHALGELRAARAGRGSSAVDRVLERVVPKGLFYNAEITGLKPAS